MKASDIQTKGGDGTNKTSTPKLGNTKNQSNKPEGDKEQSNTGHDKQGETYGGNTETD